MKKAVILLQFALSMPFLFVAQEYTSGNVTLSSTAGAEMSVQIDVSSVVTLTLTGPADRWFSVGFNATSMSSGTDVVTVRTASTITNFDGKLSGFMAPSTDNSQDWTIVSDNTVGNARTVIATRALNTGDAEDYTFLAQTGTLNIIWARGGSSSFSLTNHGSSNRGSNSLTFTEVQQNGTLEQTALNSSIYPNPIMAGETIHVPNTLNGLVYTLTDTSGKQVATGVVATSEVVIPADLPAGLYVFSIPSTGGQVNLEIK